MTPVVEEVFWALVLVASLVPAGLAWIWLIRRGQGQRLALLRKREKALETHYAELFENAHDVLFVLDPSGRVVALNQAGERVLGVGRREAVRLFLEERLVPEERELFRRTLSQLVAGELVPPTEWALLGQVGRRTILRTDLRLLHPVSGEVQIQGIAWDITPQKEAEQALRRSEARLRETLEERARLGRDLHDGIIQSIYAVGLGVSEARKLVQERPEEATARLASAVQDLNGIIREVRGFIEGLDRSPLGPASFRQALESMLPGPGQASTPHVDFQVEEAVFQRIPAGCASQLLLMAREALSNSLRHARARKLAVSLTLANDHVCLVVVDDGEGFSADALTAPGMGLKNLRARAADLGATIEIASKPGGGTRVAVRLPMGAATCS